MSELDDAPTGHTQIDDSIVVDSAKAEENNIPGGKESEKAEGNSEQEAQGANGETPEE